MTPILSFALFALIAGAGADARPTPSKRQSDALDVSGFASADECELVSVLPQHRCTKPLIDELSLCLSGLS